MVRLILIIQIPSQAHNVNIIIDGDSVEFKLKAKMLSQWCILVCEQVQIPATF